MTHRYPEIPKAKDMMSKKIYVLVPDDTVFSTIHLFNKQRISSAPVVNSQYQVIGFVSESDCLQSMCLDFFHNERRSPKIKDIMCKKIKSINEDFDLFEVEKFFHEHHLHHAPVVDIQNQLVGMISRRDLLKTIEKLVDQEQQYEKKNFEALTVSPWQDRMKVLLDEIIKH